MPLITSEYVFSDDYPTIEPSLRLDFANARALDPRITFTRASTATYVGANGLIKTAGEDEPRFDHDPATGESLGLLIEETRANIYKYSNLMNPTGNSVPSNFTANAGTAPDGTNTALKLTEKPSSDGVALQGQSIAIGAKDGPLAVFSVFAKAGEDRYLYITPYLGQSRTPPVFDLQTGAISNPDNHAVVMEPFADGWYRCSVRVARTGFASMRWGISNVANAPFSNNGIPFEGDGTSGLFVWGAQYELQTPSAVNGDSGISIQVSSFLPTSGSTVTRPADNASITGESFSNFYNSTEGTFFAEADTINPRYNDAITGYDGNNNNYSIMGTGDSPNRFQLRFDDEEPFQALTFGPNSTSAITNNVTLTPTLDVKIAGTIKQDDARAYAKGVSILTDTSIDLINPVALYIGNLSGSSEYLNGHVKKLSYYPKALPNAQLQTLTQ